MLTIISGPVKSGKTRLLLESIKVCPAEKMASRILIVPEQLSHEAERLLSSLCGDGISYSTEVLSFSRLYDRVCAVSGGGARCMLDQGGRIISARQALETVRSQLKIFAPVCGKTEFLVNIVNMIDELKSYALGPELLAKAASGTTGSLSLKLLELAKILEAYEAITAHGSSDPRDQLTLLRGKLLDGTYAQGRHFFVDGFTTFTGQELFVLEALLRQGENMTITVPWDESQMELYSPGHETLESMIRMAKSLGVEVRMQSASYCRPLPAELSYLAENLMCYSSEPMVAEDHAVSVIAADDPLDECRSCCAILRDYAMSGMRYKDMAVCYTSREKYESLLAQIAESLEIPIYQSCKKPLLSNPVARFLLLALDCVTQGMEQETVLAYLKTDFTGLEHDQQDALENYIITWAIRGNKFFSPFTMHPDGYDGKFTEETQQELQNLDIWRWQALEPLKKLRTGLKAAENVRGSLEAIYQFLIDTNIYNQLDQLLKKQTSEGQFESAQETAQIWNVLLACLQQISGVLGSTTLKDDELDRILKLALAQYQVGTIPAVLDAVNVGDINTVYGKEPKILIILGANQSLMPNVEVGGSLLSETDRKTLRQSLNIEIAPDAERALNRQIFEIYNAFATPTQALYVLYAAGGAEDVQPSFLVERIQSLFQNSLVKAPRETGLNAQDTAVRLFLNTTEEASILKSSARVPALDNAIALGKQLSLPRLEKMSPAVTKLVFGEPLALSASRLDSYASCPLEFFLRYGLRAKQRKEARFDAAEFGTFVHFILEQTVPHLVELGQMITKQDSIKLVDRNLEEYCAQRLAHVEQTFRQKYLLSRNRLEAALLVEEISKELSTTDFRPSGYELQIGGNSSIPPMIFNGRNGQGRLTGFVDRADVWDGERDKFLRIIDYKTGAKEIDYTDLSAGVGMQMLLYLFALERTGLPDVSGPLTSAGVLYFPARRNYENVSIPSTEEMKPTRRSGLILGDDMVLEAMEHGNDYRYMPVKQTKAGLGDYVLTMQQFQSLKRFVLQQTTQAVDDILSGSFSASPYYRGQSHDPCSYCAYSAVCQRDSDFKKHCYHSKITAVDFWSMLQKGGQKDG